MTLFLTSLEKTLGRISDHTGRVVPWLFVPLVIVTFAVAVLRYSLDFGIIWIQEISMYLHAIIVMSCMGYTMRHDQHVRVDIFYAKFSQITRAKINLAGHVFLLMPFVITVIVISSGYVMRSWYLMEKSLEAGGLPLVFVLKTFIPLMAVLLLIQGLANIACCLRIIHSHRDTAQAVN